MFGDQKDIGQNLKDTEQDLTKSTRSVSVPYQNSALLFKLNTKLNKLISALYIVTDIMDKYEPMRTKLRTLGLDILSDVNSRTKVNPNEKIKALLSFLDIASAVNLISEMNFNILKKEFTQLIDSIEESSQIKHEWLEEFLLQPDKVEPLLSVRESDSEKRLSSSSRLSIGHERMKTRIGVQSGGTLMKALSDKTSSLSDKNFAISKKERREDIIKSIKENGGSATIKDIKTKASGTLISCGEKTLQRELVSMIKDGVLNKTGEKRWSKYFLK